MNENDLASAGRRVLAPLCAPDSVAPSEVTEAGRDELVALLAGRIAELPRQRDRARVWRRAVQGALAAAVLVAVAGGSAALTSRHDGGREPPGAAAGATGGLTLVAGSLLADQERIEPGRRLARDTTLVTPVDASALLLTEFGAEVKIAPDSRARMPTASGTEQLELARGQVTLDVPPLPPGRVFTVLTPDASIVVHGTRFSVSIQDDGTCVRVTEGRVNVTRRRGSGVLLGAGESSGCPRVRTESEEAVEAPASSYPPRRVAKAYPSTLAQQNELLRAGLAAERAGDLETARVKLRTLLRGYPDSPLVGEARRALQRVEARAKAR